MRLNTARITRLSIAQSRFTGLLIAEAHIDGPFEFDGARSLDGPLGLAWIDARNALINGHVSGNEAKLRAKRPRASDHIPAGEREVALCLMDTEIRGSVRLVGGFVAHGGVSLDTANVRGDVIMSGAHVSAGEDDAFSAQNAKIGGMLMLNRYFRAVGTVWLHGASINDSLDLSRAILVGRIPASRTTGDRKSVVADTADIGADCRLERTMAMGPISLSGSRIRGGIAAAKLAIRASSDTAFDGDDMEVSNVVDFTDARIVGKLSLKGVEVGSSLALDGARIGFPRDDFTALDATNAVIGADATFGATAKSGRLVSKGRLDMTGLHVRGDLTFGGTHVRSLPDDQNRIAIRLERARVEGNLFFGRRSGAHEPTRRFYAAGEVNIAGASIGRDLNARWATFSNPRRWALNAKDVQIADDLLLADTYATGDLRFERAEIAGSVTWNNLTIGAKRTDPGATAPLEFRRARIGSALKAEKLITAPGAEIDLRGLRVYEVQDWKIEGWGSLAACRCCLNSAIDFDGMEYERITATVGDDYEAWRHRWEVNGIPSGIGGPFYHPRGGLFLHWILHQPHQPEIRVDAAVWGRRESDYFPQPFRQLARVLRNQGEEEAARFVTACERWATPASPLNRLLRRGFFGPLFEFGLSPKRGFAVVLAYLCLGAFGVWQAHENNMLVETSMVASIVAVPPAPTPTVAQANSAAAVLLVPASPPTHKHAFMTSTPGQGDTEELLCTDTAMNVATDFVYAADMIVPFIPLHQETKCDISTDLPLSTWWRVGKALYSVIGWIIVSIALATFAGLLRRGAGEVE